MDRDDLALFRDQLERLGSAPSHLPHPHDDSWCSPALRPAMGAISFQIQPRAWAFEAKHPYKFDAGQDPPVLLYLRAPIIPLIHAGTSTVQIGDEPGLSTGAVAAIATFTLCAVVLLMFPIVFRFLPRTTVRVGVIGWLLVAVLLPAQFWAIGNAASHLSYTMKEVATKVQSLLGPESRVIDELAFILKTKCCNLIMLDRRWAGYHFYGKALIPSFRPTHVAVSGQAPEADFAKYVEECLLEGVSLPRERSIRTSFAPRENGGYRFALSLGEVSPAPGK